MSPAARAFRTAVLAAAAAYLFCAAGAPAAQESMDAGEEPPVPKSLHSSPAVTAGEGIARPPERSWKGEAEAGMITAAGNSRSESLRARLKVQYAPQPWQHGVTADFVRLSEGGVRTTEQYNAAVKSDRSLTRRSYLFATARYEADRVAGYSPRVSETAGYGRRFPFSERMKLEAETGAGGRHTWSTDGSRQSEAIVRLAARFSLAFGAKTEFAEDTFTEFGEKNVHTESQTSLSTRINSDFSMKANVTVKHDTVVAPGVHKTDTITSVTLVYDL